MEMNKTSTRLYYSIIMIILLALPAFGAPMITPQKGLDLRNTFNISNAKNIQSGNITASSFYGTLGCGNISGAASNLCTITQTGSTPFTNVDNIFIYNDSGTVTFNQSRNNATIQLIKANNATNADTARSAYCGVITGATSNLCTIVDTDTDTDTKPPFTGVDNRWIFNSSGTLTWNETRGNATYAAIGTKAANATHADTSSIALTWASLTGYLARWFFSNGGQLDFNETRLNATIDARDDVGASPFTGVDNIYLYNNSGAISLNDTRLNLTIDERDSDTTYTAGNDLNLTGITFGVNRTTLKTYFDTLYQTLGSAALASWTNITYDTELESYANWTQINNGTILTNNLINLTYDGEISSWTNLTYDVELSNYPNKTELSQTNDTKVNRAGDTITGSLTIQGNLTVLGTQINASVTNQYLNGSFLPQLNNIFNIGSTAFTWAAGYFNTLMGSLGWANLTDYPSACPAGQAVTQIGDALTCQAFDTSGSDDVQTSWTNYTLDIELANYINTTQFDNGSIVRSQNTSWIRENDRDTNCSVSGSCGLLTYHSQLSGNYPNNTQLQQSNATKLNVTTPFGESGGNITGFYYNLSLKPCANGQILEYTTTGNSWICGSDDTGAGGTSSPWNSTGTNTYLNATGNSVGIGTTTPSQRLEVSGNTTLGNLTIDQKVMNKINLNYLEYNSTGDTTQWI